MDKVDKEIIVNQFLLYLMKSGVLFCSKSEGEISLFPAQQMLQIRDEFIDGGITHVTTWTDGTNEDGTPKIASREESVL